MEVDYAAQLQRLIEKLNVPFPFFDSDCHNEHLLELAREMTGWKTIAPWLGFSPPAVEDIDEQRYDGEGKCQLMLMQWKRFKGSDATYRELATGMIKSSRINLAEFVVRASNRIPSQTETISRSFYQSSYHKRQVTPVFPSSIAGETTNYRSSPNPPPAFSSELLLPPSRLQLPPFSSPASNIPQQPSGTPPSMDASTSVVPSQQGSEPQAQHNGIETMMGTSSFHRQGNQKGMEPLTQYNKGAETHHNVPPTDPSLYDTRGTKRGTNPQTLSIAGTRERHSVQVMDTSSPQYLSDQRHLLELGITAQIQDQYSKADSICVATQNSFIPHGVRDKLTSLCSGTASSPLIPHLTTTEIIQILQRNEQLELEKRKLQDDYERRLENEKLEKQQLERHLHQAHANAQKWERYAIDTALKHQMGLCCPRCNGKNGREETDSQHTTPMLDQDRHCINMGNDCDSGQHLYYSPMSYYTHKERVTTTTISHWNEQIDVEHHEHIQDEHENCNTSTKKDKKEEEEDHKTVCKLYRQITVCMEERELIEETRHKIAVHNLKLLETNTQLTDLVYSSLESLGNDCTDDAAGSGGDGQDDRERLISELTSVHGHLERSRLARHVSCP